jgi:hypothetical protein
MVENGPEQGLVRDPRRATQPIEDTYEKTSFFAPQRGWFEAVESAI